MNSYERLVVAATKAGYNNISEDWCKDFLEAARKDGRERSVKNSFRERYNNLNRGWKKRFVCFRRIVIVYEGRRPVDFHALVEVHDQILRSTDRPPSGTAGAEALFAVAVSIQLPRNEHRKDRIRDSLLNHEN